MVNENYDDFPSRLDEEPIEELYQPRPPAEWRHLRLYDRVKPSYRNASRIRSHQPGVIIAISGAKALVRWQDNFEERFLLALLVRIAA